MVFHLKKIFLFSKYYFNSIINLFLNKFFFFFKKKNVLFFINYFVKFIFFNNILFYKKNFFLINNFFFFKKKLYCFKNKFRFLNSFFGYINFYNFNNFNQKINKQKSFFLILPKTIFFYKKKYRQIFIFFLIKKKNFFKNISILKKFFIKKIKNTFIKNIIIFKKIINNYFVKKKIFFKNICKIKKNIFIGNLIQCVISNILILKKKINKYILENSNYNFFFIDKNILKTNSPEFLLRLEKKILFTKPIAGTLNVDFQKKILLKNKKEISEHLMLFDLSLNDIFLNCKKIFIKRILFCEYHKNLIHLVSEICFNIFNKNFFEKMRNIFPAGTLSGAPKKIAIEFIKKIELKKRFFYGGIFFFENFNNLESCILIRFMFYKKKTIKIQSGAGIIDRSINYLEWLETISKKQNLLK